MEIKIAALLMAMLEHVNWSCNQMTFKMAQI